MIITMLHDSTLIRLDFGEWGYIDLPPEVAMTLVSGQSVRDQIRRAVDQSRKARRELGERLTMVKSAVVGSTITTMTA